METDKLDTILTRLDAISSRVHEISERQRKQDEFLSEMSPVLKDMMATATTRLDVLDKKGYFAFARELVGVTERVVEGFSPEDVRKLGDAVVAILETVRTMTQPEVLAIAGEASESLKNADRAEPIGLIGMVRASRDEDVQKGMAVMMDVVRNVGRVAEVVSIQRKRKGDASSQKLDRAARLQAITGSRKKTPLGIERPRSFVPSERKDRSTPLGATSGCAVPSTKVPVVAAVIEGVGFTTDGHLADAKEWTESLAGRLAEAQGIELDEARWAIVRFARGDFESTGMSPNIRRLTQGANVTTKDLYMLFPKAPARTIAKIAGIPKPAGCI